MYFYKKERIMSNAIFKVPTAINEPVKSYIPGSAEREELISKYKEMYEHPTRSYTI